VEGPPKGRLSYHQTPGVLNPTIWTVIPHYPTIELMSNPSSTYHLARFFWIRLLAFVFFAAFLSVFLQLPGLCGSHGLLPAKIMISEAIRLLPVAWKRLWIFPTFCWISSSDFSLNLQCILGLLASAGVLLGFAPGFLMASCWALYLSVAQAGQEFYHWPFDYLLLECGLLAALLAPWRFTWFKPDPKKEAPPTSWETALALTVLFKVFFLPGAAHLSLGDPSWPTLEALSLQFWTQPLPTAFGLTLSHFPLIFLKFLTGFLLLLEMCTPLLLLFAPRIRRFAFFPLAALAIANAWTGDSIWTGVLLLALSLWTLEDISFPTRVWNYYFKTFPDKPSVPKPNLIRRTFLGLYTAILGVTFLGFFFGLLGFQPLGSLGVWVYRGAYPTRSFNPYFRIDPIPTHRTDLTVEGTSDGMLWKEYPFRTKPGDPSITPACGRWTLRRLDYRVAEAALNHCEDSPFLAQLCASLLVQDTEVLSLLAANPFPDQPPIYVRVRKYEYRLANAMEREKTGDCWVRDSQGDFCPEIKLPK
jgi:hypothetical protein